jgi:hypothetical protein
VSKITESTLIPISLVITVVSISVWIAAVSFETKANTVTLDKTETKVQFLEEKVIKQNEMVIERLSRIEEQLKGKR